MRSFESELENLREQSLARQLRTLDSPQDVTVVHEGRELLNFSSNDYLGLANSPQLREAFKAAVDRHGTGAGASRLISGSLSPHSELEDTIARFKGTEAALSFSSGFAAAHGLGALLQKDDIVILDKLCHASLIDAARLSGARLRVYPHRDLDKLASHLQWARDNLSAEGRTLVVTESVFSMDGDRAPLREIVALKNEHGALLLVDEAHALGLLGPGGQGLAAELDIAPAEIDIHMGTLGKAAGVSGGYLAGSADLIRLLINRARSFIYSTAPPPALAATASAAIELLASAEGETRRAALWKNIHHLHDALHPDATSAPESAIIPHILGSEDRALAAGAALLEAGFLVPAIRFPTVARGTARLRITLTANHRAEQIDELAATIDSLNE